MTATVEELARGVYPACALLAGMQLDLLTPLGERPSSAAELAEILAVDAERLETLLYALVAAGFVAIEELEQGVLVGHKEG